MKQLYVPKNFSRDSLTIIGQADEICRDYARRGYELTLRQLYYQFVARGLLANSDRNYKRLGSIINDARLAGEIDWNHLVDRTRQIGGGESSWTAEDIVSYAAGMVTRDHWAIQPNYVEVWVEKDALIGVIQRAAQRVGVRSFSCRGYTSQSAVWQASQRLGRRLSEGKSVTVIHLGDHDPSGIDMTRDIEDRLRLFIEGDGEDSDELEIRRIALNMDQVRQYNPPPNPAKITDSRFEGYQAIHGDESWELDALDPDILDTLISGEVEGLRDMALWAEVDEEIEEDKAILTQLNENWDDVKAFLAEVGE